MGSTLSLQCQKLLKIFFYCFPFKIAVDIEGPGQKGKIVTAFFFYFRNENEKGEISHPVENN